MAEAKPTKTTSKKSKKINKNQFIKAYKTMCLENGQPPGSVFLFTKQIGVREEEFYTYFGSFDAIQKEVWIGFIEDTIEQIRADETYADYSTREKLLSFYYVMIERLKKDRSFIKHTLSSDLNKLQDLSILKPVREHFITYVQELISEGMASGEIQVRPMISDRYKDGLWLQLIFIISFWLKDDSAAFANTDAAIEKSVNLSYDLMGSGPLDRIVDLTKFIWQNR